MILLSVGHKLTAKGACNGNVCEYDLANKWVQRIKEFLDEDGIPCKIVPTGSLTSKVEFINNQPDAFAAMELHFNSNVNAKGSETLYYPNSIKGKELAESIQKEFTIQGVFQPNRGAKEAWYKQDKPNVVDYAGDVEGDETITYFVRKTKCTAVIVEPDFIYNLDRIEKWELEGCYAIANALQEYYYYHK